VKVWIRCSDKLVNTQLPENYRINLFYSWHERLTLKASTVPLYILLLSRCNFLVHEACYNACLCFFSLYPLFEKIKVGWRNHLAVCLRIPRIVAAQQHGKRVPTAMNAHVSDTRYVLEGKEEIISSRNLLLYIIQWLWISRNWTDHFWVLITFFNLPSINKNVAEAFNLNNEPHKKKMQKPKPLRSQFVVHITLITFNDFF
jgi:hypothetical protein